ncbi:tail assembly protein [Xanthomonas phage HXX_Dennis]|nr:tail assembly protein [Xanthomonas phage HXX_Dennis]
MTVRVYSSADPGAPAVRGNTAGDIINLMDKCLVTGYGSKAGAGWTKPFTGTNVAAFKTGAGSNGMYLRIEEPVDTNTNYPSAKVRGYETMTDVNTGNGPFPAPSRLPNGLFWYKSYSGSAAADPRQWWVVASESFVIFMIQTYPSQWSSSPGYYSELFMFGDLQNTGPNDAYATIILGETSTSGNSSQIWPMDSVNVASTRSGLYMPRAYTGIGGEIQAGWHHDYVKSGVSDWGSDSSYLQYPHGPDGALYMSPVWVHQPGGTNAAAIRGTLPGVWVPLQRGLARLDTFAGQGQLAGKNFLVWQHYTARAAIEISDTWGT